MESETNWRSAISNVYDVFSNYRRPHTLDAADKHDVPQIMSKLTAAALSELSEDNLGAYAGSALYTIGTLNDYKHFLPRIIEHSAHRTSWIGLDPQVIANKLNYAHFGDWPGKEREAIRSAFIATWKRLRNESSHTYDSPSVLCANLIIGNAATPLLSDWLPLSNSNGVLQLANLVREVASGLDERVYWNEAPQTERNILQDWIRSTAVREALVNGQERVDDEDRWEVESALLEL